jgi:hypothetical protein
MSAPDAAMRRAAGALGAALAMIFFAAAAPARGQQAAPGVAIACTTPQDVWDYLNAVDEDDQKTMHELLGGTCRSLRGARYVLLEDRNGMEKILVFDRPGDWEAARVFYALAESIEPEPPPQEPPRL